MEKTEQRQENKMGIMPVKKLIVTMSLPMMVSMLVQALYNIVDSIFVARLSEDALTGVTLAFPIQSLMIALGSGTGVGINALLSKSLGEKNYDQSDRAACNGLLLCLVNYVIFVLVGIFVSSPFIKSQTSSPAISSAGCTYLHYVCLLSAAVFFQMTFERLLQATGRTVLSMWSQLTGAVINVIMDPILIFGLLGAPKLGVAGAAIATVFGQTIAACIGLCLNLKYNKDIRITLKNILTPHGDTIKKIYVVAVPTILMMSVGAVMNFCMNHILIAFTSTAVAVFGVYFKLQSFFFMPVFGLNNGMIPVLAYNYGARKKDRIKEALGFSLKLAVIIMCLGTVIFETMPGALLKLFSASGKMMAIGIPALRIIAIHYPIAGFSIALGSVFQAFSKSVYSMIVSLGRQLVVLIPAAWLLSLTGNVNAVWWAFPIAEVVSLILTLIFYFKLKREIIEVL